MQVMDPQMKQWPSMVQGGIQYPQTQQQIPVPITNPMSMPSDGIPQLPMQSKQPQKLYIDDSMMPPHSSMMRGGTPSDAPVQMSKRRACLVCLSSVGKAAPYSVKGKTADLGMGIPSLIRLRR